MVMHCWPCFDALEPGLLPCVVLQGVHGSLVAVCKGQTSCVFVGDGTAFVACVEFAKHSAALFV